MEKFNEMDMCWHSIRLCNGVIQKLRRTFGSTAYRSEYRGLMQKLADEIKVAGCKQISEFPFPVPGLYLEL